MKRIAAVLILWVVPCSAVPPPSLAGVVAVVVGIADHPALIMRGLRAAGRAVTKPFRYTKGKKKTP